MLALGELTLNNLHRLFRESNQDGKGACEPALAKPAMTDGGDAGFTRHAITNGSTCATAKVDIRHCGLQWGQGLKNDGERAR